MQISETVKNLDRETMHFGLAGHPGFRIPFAEGTAFEDYELRFIQPCKPERIGFTEQLFLSEQNSPYVLHDDQVIPLKHKLYDEDAVMLKGMARSVSL